MLRSVAGDLVPSLAILPNEGLGSLKFGSSTEEVSGYLGAPDKVYDNSHYPLALGWSYRRPSLNVAFHADDTSAGQPFRLILFTSSDVKTTLHENRIIGRPEPEVLGFLKSHGHHSFDVVGNDGYPNSMSINIIRARGLNIDLHFQRGLLRAVQWETPTREFPFGYCFP